MLSFATAYYLTCLIGTVGAIQIGASFGELRGLLFFKSPYVTRPLGVALVIVAFVFFFGTGERNINDYEGGLDGNVQALLFFLGVISGGAFTFVVSSFVNLSMRQDTPLPGNGLEDTKRTTFLKALHRSLLYWWKNWRSQIKNYFSG